MWPSAVALRCVSLALASTGAAQTALENEIARALDRARPALLRHLETERGGRLALLALAAVHDDVPPRVPEFRTAIDQLARERLLDTYALSLRLMVMAELPDFPQRMEAAQRDTKRLLACQKNGVFAYSPTRQSADLSNTQYGALGLRAAQVLGCRVPAGRWRALLSRVLAWQARDGGFGYQGRPRRGYASMTVAGIACLELGLQYLHNERFDRAKVRKRIDKAWAWMAKHASEIGSPSTSWCHYFHYGLERAAVLSARKLVGETDWYRTGAEMLVRTQLPDGGWSRRAGTGDGAPPRGRSAGVSTAFAILFLRRRFQRVVSVVTPNGVKALYLPADATKRQIDESVRLEVARGMQAVPDLLRAMRSKVPARRWVAAAALRQIAGRDFGYDPYRDQAASAESIRAAERWWLTEASRAEGGR